MSERVAMVGAGYFAQFQLEGWHDAGALPVALCDLDAGRADALARQHGVQATFRDAGQMFDAVRPTLVEIGRAHV